jgi:hypothetical protein
LGLWANTFFFFQDMPWMMFFVSPHPPFARKQITQKKLHVVATEKLLKCRSTPRKQKLEIANY